MIGWAGRYCLAALLVCQSAMAGTFITADNGNPEEITHPSGYTGNGGQLQVTMCIATDSESPGEIAVALQNIANTVSRLLPENGNLVSGGANNIPSGQIDFESVAVHEVGHCLGLGHPNAATDSGLPGADRNYTAALQGPNGMFDIAPGVDGVKGSSDDPRGDDINIHWFEKAMNNPFSLPQIIDGTTFSVNLADLPAGHLFAANADRSVGALLGFSASEAVMQQGTFSDEAQRELGMDDVATLRLGMAGTDEIQDTNDDYTFRLVYGGVSDACDLTVHVGGSNFASCTVGLGFVSSGHLRVTGGDAFFGSASNVNWFFNQQSNLAAGVNIDARVNLQGAAVESPAGVPFMQDGLRDNGELPLAEPYTALDNYSHVGGGGESITSPLTAISNRAGDSIVDWVFVELRSSANAAQVVATRSALLQRDGDIVDTDGGSLLNFPQLSPANRFMAVRHRNHLGVMTGLALATSSLTPRLDFTNSGSANFVVDPQYDGLSQTILDNGQRALWGGNGNGDSALILQGPANDASTPFFDVLLDPANTSLSANFIAEGYLQGDFDMDGQAIFQGPGSEINFLFFNILLHPLNSGLLNNFSIQEQLP